MVSSDSSGKNTTGYQFKHNLKHDLNPLEKLKLIPILRRPKKKTFESYRGLKTRCFGLNPTRNLFFYLYFQVLPALYESQIISYGN